MSEDTNRANPKPPSVDRLSQLWRRINDHKMVQWTVAYVALAYGVQHGIILTSESFEWPNAVARISMLLLALGLPLVMTFAWYHGERASRQFSKAELTIISILLVIGSLLFFVFVRPSEELGAQTAENSQTVVAAARGTSPVQPGGISIAVLPFVNLSSDKEQEFFSDGMTEEITSALAKVPNLRVVARTSAFEFKGQNRDVQTIAQALHATHVIEGSVRKEGNQVRITAQLIKAGDGTHLWTESYDRELKGVFAVQEDIAQAIAGALRVPLGLQQGESLVSNRTNDVESYDQYLRAQALVRARTLPDAIKLLESVVGRDPAFAPAWGLLAQAYVLVPLNNLDNPEPLAMPLEEARRFAQTFADKAERAAREAIRLDSRNALAFAVLARIQGRRGKWAASEDLYKQALALDPNEPEGLHAYSNDMLAVVGRLKDALSIREKLRTLEPFVPIYNIFTASIMQYNGLNQAAIPILQAIPVDAAGGARNAYLARAYAAEGRYAEASDTLLAMRTNRVNRRYEGSVEDAARLLRSAPTKVRAPQALPRLDNELNFIYAYVGALDRVLEFPERIQEIQSSPAVGIIWLPEVAPVRKTERFKTLVRKAGMVDYWRARGWPDLCHPTTGDDFECN